MGMMTRSSFSIWTTHDVGYKEAVSQSIRRIYVKCKSYLRGCLGLKWVGSKRSIVKFIERLLANEPGSGIGANDVYL